MKKLVRISLISITVCCACGGAHAASRSGQDGNFGSRVVSMREAVKMAIAHSPDVLMAEAQSVRAGESLRESRSLNLPQIHAGTGLAYNVGFPLSIEGSAPSIFRISGSKSIFSTRNANLIRGAEESVNSSRLGVEAARNGLAAKTAMVYYELFQARKMIQLAAERLEVIIGQQELIEAAFEAGRVLPLEVAQAKNAVAAARHQLLVAREQAGIAETELRELTGLTDDRAIQTMEPDLNSPVFEMSADDLYGKVLSRNPEILQAESSIRAAEYNVAAEKGDRLPQINIISEYALFSRANNFDDYYKRFDRNNYLFGLSVRVPLFTGYRTDARAAQRRQAVFEEQYRLRRLKSDLKITIQRALSALRIARGATALAQSDLETAEAMVRMNDTLLESGKISIEQLKESHLQLRQKELARLEADQGLFERQLDLLRITGSLVSAIE
ncbi:MAG TPA: TolC family protein [Acidobacteriota bacterium]|nr:TolC family protein [Acidobacteriota bacterium]